MQKLIWTILLVAVCNLLLGQEEYYPDSDLSIVRVEIQPERVTLKPGETVQFSFRAFDAKGEEVPAGFSWAFNGGTLRQNGTYTAGDQPGEYILEAQVSTGVKASAAITIVDITGGASRKVAKVTITPNSVVLWPGERQKFEFAAFNDKGKSLSVGYRISFSGGEMDYQSVYTAGNRPGKYKIRVQTEDGQQSDAEIIIVLQGAVKPTPGTPASSTPAAQSQTSATSAGQTPATSQPADSSDQATAGTSTQPANPTQVDAPTAPETKPIAEPATTKPAATSMAPGKLARFALVPSKIRVRPSGKCKFQLIATDDQGRKVAARISWLYRGGRLDSDGVFTAGIVSGQYPIIATSDTGLVAKALVGIIEGTVPETPYWIELEPPDVTLKPGEQQKFQYKLTDESGNPVQSETIQWDYLGGTFDSATLLYTAGTEIGSFYLEAFITENVRTRAHIEIKP